MPTRNYNLTTCLTTFVLAYFKGELFLFRCVGLLFDIVQRLWQKRQDSAVESEFCFILFHEITFEVDHGIK